MKGVKMVSGKGIDMFGKSHEVSAQTYSQVDSQLDRLACRRIQHNNGDIFLKLRGEWIFLRNEEQE
jgi:hypothetical protein